MPDKKQAFYFEFLLDLIQLTNGSKKLTTATAHWLAILADCYNPSLFLLCVIVSFQQSLKGNHWYWLRLTLIAVCSYGVLFLDKGLSIWSNIALDFSSHTSTSIGMVFFLSALRVNAIRIAAVLTFLAYCFLMTILNYHTWADIISTAVVMALIYWPIIYFTERLIIKALRKQQTFKPD